MINFNAGQLFRNLDQLRTQATLANQRAQKENEQPELREAREQRGMNWLIDQQQAFYPLLRSLEVDADLLGLEITKSQIAEFRIRLMEPQLTFHTIETECTSLRDSIITNLASRKFAFIPFDRIKFFEQDALFGAPFHAKVSTAINTEIKAAANCLAADLNTAAVFHLMRVAERGLHALAIDLKVPTKPYPLEFSGWKGVIEDIDQELRKRKAAIQPVIRGSSKDEELDFYQGLLTNLVFFKDAYRNPVSHLRGDFDELEARSICIKVEDFMLRLAKKVPLA